MEWPIGIFAERGRRPRLRQRLAEHLSDEVVVFDPREVFDDPSDGQRGGRQRLGDGSCLVKATSGGDNSAATVLEALFEPDSFGGWLQVRIPGRRIR